MKKHGKFSMIRMVQGVLLGAVTALSGGAGAVLAQSLEEVVVTARRQVETLKDVPATVSVITADTLERTGATRAEDFIELTPGVSIITDTAEAGDTQINIRGMNGSRDAESSVALVVDGILKTNIAQLNQNHGLLRQVEILKGPQGAIYGRNAAAGAIVLTTLKPTEELQGKIGVTLAEDSTQLLRGYLAGPLSMEIPGIETAGFSLAFEQSSSDGFYANEFLGDDVVDDQESLNLDGRLLLTLSPETELDFKLRYADLEGSSINFNAAFHLGNLASVPGFHVDVNDHDFRYYGNIEPKNNQETLDFSLKLDHRFETMALTAWMLYNDIDQSLSADGTSADLSRYWAAARANAVSEVAQATADACQASVTEINGMALNFPAPINIGTSPTGSIFDPANGSLFGAYSPTTCDGTQYQEREQKDSSFELRLASLAEGPMQWQVGAYYLEIERRVGVSLGADLGSGVIKELYNAADSANPTSQLYHDRFDTQVFAFFGSLDWELNAATQLGLSLRYDVEDREVRNLVPVVNDPVTGGPLNPGQAGGAAIASQSEEFKQFQPKLSLRRDVDENNVAYANWGVGFKSGGFNNSGSAATVNAAFNGDTGRNALIGVYAIDANVAIEDNFGKETSSAFEAGVKGTLLDGRLNYDLSTYRMDVEDMQFFEFFVGGFGLLRVVSNIDEVELYGAELALDLRVLDGLKLIGSVGLNESEITKNRSRTYTEGNKSPGTPEFTANFGLQYDTQLADFGLVLRADYRLTGKTHFHTVQDQSRATLFSALFPDSPLDAAFEDALNEDSGNGNYSVAEREEYGIINVRASLESTNWTLSAYIKNLTDEEYLAEVISAIEFGGSFISPGSQRRAGLEFTYRF